MIIGYILLGMTVGFFAAAASFGLGASFWSVLGVYTLSGFAGMVVVPVAYAVISRLTAHRGPQDTADHDLASVPVQPTVSSPTPAPHGQEVFTVLAVDDDPFILDLVDTIAADAGAFQVVTASSGAEALALLTDTGRSFDYLLCDISMPQMSGIDLCRAVRQMPRYQDIPIVMLTARRDMAHMAEAFQAGATDYATKPFDIEALRQRFQAAHALFMAEPEATRPVTTKARAKTRVDHHALSQYLTLLSERDAAAVQVFALRIDRMDAMRAHYSPARLAGLLDDVADTVADSLTPRQTVMAFTAENDLIIATGKTDPLELAGLETRVARCVRAFDSKADHRDSAVLGVSIGDPVRLLGPKKQRTRLALDGALDAVEVRAQSRQQGSVTYLPRAFGV